MGGQRRLEDGGRVPGLLAIVVQRGPDVLRHADGLVGAPEQAAAEEAGEEEDAVVPLGAGAGHVELVEEPVEVEEGGGEFVEDEGGAVEVDKGTLYVGHVSVAEC